MKGNDCVRFVLFIMFLFKFWRFCTVLLLITKNIGNTPLILKIISECSFILTACSCHVTYAFQSESTLYSCLNASLLEAGAKSEGEVTVTGLEPRTTQFLNKHSTIWPNLNKRILLFCLYKRFLLQISGNYLCYKILTACSPFECVYFTMPIIGSCNEQGNYFYF